MCRRECLTRNFITTVIYISIWHLLLHFFFFCSSPHRHLPLTFGAFAFRAFECPTHIYTLFSTISSEGNEEEENEEEEKKQGIPVVSLCLSSAQDSDEVEEDDDVAALLSSFSWA